MSLRKFLAAAGGALALLLGGGIAHAEKAGTAVAAQPAPGPALWEVKENGTTVYLFGTVHALPENIHWYDKRIANALDKSSELVTEIDLRNRGAAARELASHAKLPAGETLRSLMSAKDRTEYDHALKSLGLPANALDRVEPWFAAMNLSMLPLVEAGYRPRDGVEVQLDAHAQGKQRAALETVDQQIALFDKLPMAQQLTILEQTVDDVPVAAERLDAMVNAWIRGEPEKLGKLINKDMDDPVLYKRLLTDRNARWAGWIARRLKQPGTVFVAVGAGHLAGPGSVQDQLRKRGLSVKRVWE